MRGQISLSNKKYKEAADFFKECLVIGDIYHKPLKIKCL